MATIANPFQVGAEVLVTVCDRHVTQRQIGRVWDDGKFHLAGAPRDQRWLSVQAHGHWRAYPLPGTADSAAFIVLAP